MKDNQKKNLSEDFILTYHFSFVHKNPFFIDLLMIFLSGYHNVCQYFGALVHFMQSAKYFQQCECYACD